MAGPLTPDLNPLNFAVAGTGKVYVSGALTGLGLAESHPFPGERDGLADVSNAQVFVQKVDGEFLFFIAAGIYSFPALGAAYTDAASETRHLYGPLPQAYLKLAPTSALSIEIGKLPGIIGAEYPFTYENMNIFRGLLWNQEIPFTRGVQVNYASGSFSYSLSLNDGFYSNRYNWISGMATWTLDGANSLSLIGSGNLGETGYGSDATPLFQNNDRQLDNLMYSYTSGPWIAQGYVQYAETKAGDDIGIAKAASTWGAGLLANYSFPRTHFSLAGRAEYISSSGSPTDGSPNLLYGSGSKAESITLTPCFQAGIFFVRAEASVVKALSTTKGEGLGPNGSEQTQTRISLESGILF